jgi:hypothetical protein
LLLLATVGLLKPARHASRRARSTVWIAFLLGIGVSLAANMAAAPTLAWQPILVAGWPPVALLFSVELLAHRPAERAVIESAPRASGTERARAEQSSTADKRDKPREQQRETPGEGESPADGSRSSVASRSKASAEQIMWDYFQQQTVNTVQLHRASAGSTTEQRYPYLSRTGGRRQKPARRRQGTRPEPPARRPGPHHRPGPGPAGGEDERDHLLQPCWAVGGDTRGLSPWVVIYRISSAQ